MPTCAGCGVPIAEERAVFVAGKRPSDAPLALCSVCAEKIEQVVQSETQHPNIVLAVAFAVATALLTAFLWYQIVVRTGLQLGILAIGVGWLIARAVIYASGNKRGPALQWISTAATLFAMLVAQYLIMRHFLGEALVEEGYPGQLPLFLPIGLIWALLKEGLGNAPMTLFFWVIAMWEGYSLPRARSLRRVLPQTPPPPEMAGPQ